MRNYLKYLLNNSSILEKREVFDNIKTKIQLFKKNLII